MRAVRVIRRYGERAFRGGVKFFLALAERESNPLRRAFQQVAPRALVGGRTDLLAVEERADVHPGTKLRGDQRLYRGKGGGKIVNARGGEKFSAQSRSERLLSADQIQIVINELFVLFQRSAEQGVQSVRGRSEREKRLGVGLHVDGKIFVDFAVQVHRERGNREIFRR